MEVLVRLHVGSIEDVSRMKQIYMSFAYDYASTLCSISSNVIYKEREECDLATRWNLAKTLATICLKSQFLS